MKTKFLLITFFCFGLIGAQNTNFKISMSYPETSNAGLTTIEMELIQSKIVEIKNANGIDTQININLLKDIDSIINRYATNNNSIYSAYSNLYIKKIKDLTNDKVTLINEMNAGNLNESDLDAKTKQIRKLDEEINQFDTKLNDLNDIKFLKSKKPFHLFLGSRKSNAFYKISYDEDSNSINFLNNNGILLGNKTGAIYSELASGNLKLIRVSIGTMVSNSSAEENPKEEEAFNRLATSGGNTVLNFEYPFLYSYDSNNQFNLIGRLLGKCTADFPAFGSQTEDFAGSASLGVDLYIDFATSNNEIRFYGNFNNAKYFGTDVFKENLGIDNRDFTFGKLTGGVVIKEKVNLSVMFNTFSSEAALKNRHIIIGGSLLF